MAKKKQGGNTIEIVRNIAEPIASSLGLDLWDVRFIKEGTQWYLRIFIDKKEGIYVKAKEGIILLLEIQAENSKKMRVQDFLLGNKIEIGEVLV